jgi:hypothetical protein
MAKMAFTPTTVVCLNETVRLSAKLSSKKYFYKIRVPTQIKRCPGPEYTIKAQNSSFAIGSQIFQIGNSEKDQWFLLIFSNESAQRIPDDLRNLQLGGKADAFFKANRPVYLASRIRVYPNGEGSDVVIDPLVSIRQEGRELGERLKSGEITKKEFEHEKKMILKKYGYE